MDDYRMPNGAPLLVPESIMQALMAEAALSRDEVERRLGVVAYGAPRVERRGVTPGGIEWRG